MRQYQKPLAKKLAIKGRYQNENQYNPYWILFSKQSITKFKSEPEQLPPT